MIDDDRPSRQLMRCRASWERQDARRRRHQPRSASAPRSHRRSGNQGGNLPSRKPLKTRETRKFSQRSATLLRGRKDAPRGPGRSRRPFAAEVAGARSRRKFSLLQSFEKSENAEILRRHRGAPCLPNVDGNPRGRLPLTTASWRIPLLRNSKAAQSRVCLDRRPDGDRRAIVDFLNRGVSVAVVAAREGLAAKRSGPEMAPQRFEKIESAPGNGMVWEASNPQDMVHGRAADRARLRLTSRKNALLQKKAPNALKSLDAELKLQPRSTARRRGLAGRRPGCFLAAPRDDGWRP